MRRVLMISAAFPPTGGPGVQRSAKFAKYLPHFGWWPTIWATEPLDNLPRDESILADIPAEVTVHRRGAGGSARRVRQSIRQTAARIPGVSTLAARIDRRLTRGLARPLAADHMPDELVTWAQESLAPLERLCAESGIEAIYSTFSPASNHLLALRLREVTRLPWIADFRDLWTDDYRYVETDPARRVAHRQLEQRILEAADAVIGVSERQAEILAAHVPAQRSKFLTITNGFDADDFQGMTRRRAHDGRWVLAHVGRLDRWRACDAWFDGMREFCTASGAAKKACVVRMVGHAAKGIELRLQEAGVRYEVAPYCPHRQAIQEMFDADALLLLVPEGPNADSVIPAKLFECLASRRPILAIGPEGGACEGIVRAANAGHTVSFSAETIARALRAMFDQWASGTEETVGDANTLGVYSRRELTGRLAAVLNGIADGHPPPTKIEAGRAAFASQH